MDNNRSTTITNIPQKKGTNNIGPQSNSMIAIQNNSTLVKGNTSNFTFNERTLDSLEALNVATGI